MTSLLRRQEDEPPPGRPGPDALFVNGRRYANTAAKFWASLIDEVREEFPDCSLAELSAATSRPLNADCLHPENALKNDLEELMDADMEDVMRRALQELALYGPPAAVHVRLLADKRELFANSLPLECVDEEILPYLLVWPLQWAGIPDPAWNSEFLHGAFTGEDKKRRRTYRVSFRLTNRHLSEGLFHRMMTFTPAVTGPAVRRETEGEDT